MKTLITFQFFFIINILSAQQVDTPQRTFQFLELSSRNPQPRLNESFSIDIDMNPIRRYVFSLLSARDRASNKIIETYNDALTIMYIEPTKIGKYEIGPLQFSIGQTKYQTNKYSYEVVDSLPIIDEGLWIRTIKKSDSTFCIIIEQRIPENKITRPLFEHFTALMINPDSLDPYRYKYSSSETGFKTQLIKGEQKKFASSHSTSCLEITDRKKRIKITKDDFAKLPQNYQFEDVVIQ